MGKDSVKTRTISPERGEEKPNSHQAVQTWGLLIDPVKGILVSFWDSFITAVAWFFWATIFISYLMVLFSVLADVVRDDSLSGGKKTVWVVFLILAPFITTLIYLIARGKGMGERNAQAASANQKAAEEYIRSVAGDIDPTGQIERAAKLRDSGVISAEEFAQIKAKALQS